MKRLLSVVCFLLPFSAHAETKIDCPDAYPTALLTTRGVPAGWNGIAHVTGMKMVLSAAGVIVGPPKEEAQGLLHGKETKTKTGIRVKFEYLNKFTEPQEKWIYCAYGLGANVQLLQRIPDQTDTCVADYSRNAFHGYDIRITCH